MRVQTGLALSLCLALPARAATYRPIHEFSGSVTGDGETPVPELVADGTGRLYGTTQFGGQYGFGTVVRIVPPESDGATGRAETLHSFSPSEGNDPKGGVLLGPGGVLYGTTHLGGANDGGTVFRLDAVDDHWTLTTLHAFNPAPAAHDGFKPIAGLVFGPGGLLYGTTGAGGAHGAGTVFALSPRGDAGGYTIIHDFGGYDGDAAVPNFGRLLVRGQKLYGTAGGGAHLVGAVYQLALAGPGKPEWRESVLHSFGPGDAAGPNNGLTAGPSGTLYGCAAGGKNGSGDGAIYRLTPPPPGTRVWGETLLYSFGANPDEPGVTECALLKDPAGRLLGTSSGGGQFGQGTLFRLRPPAEDQVGWTLEMLHSFGPAGSDGLQPTSGLVAGGQGVYYGVTYFGGAGGRGTVYRIKP